LLFFTIPIYTYLKKKKNGFNPLLFFLFQFDFNWKTVENNSNSFIGGGKKICLKVSFKTHKKKRKVKMNQRFYKFISPGG